MNAFATLTKFEEDAFYIIRRHCENDGHTAEMNAYRDDNQALTPGFLEEGPMNNFDEDAQYNHLKNAKQLKKAHTTLYAKMVAKTEAEYKEEK